MIEQVLFQVQSMFKYLPSKNCNHYLLRKDKHDNRRLIIDYWACLNCGLIRSSLLHFKKEGYAQRLKDKNRGFCTHCHKRYAKRIAKLKQLVKNKLLFQQLFYLAQAPLIAFEKKVILRIKTVKRN